MKPHVYDHFRLAPEQLRLRCDPDRDLSFLQTTRDAPPLTGVIGQDRAERAMKFGLSMEAPGYHLFVVGVPGTGKNTYVQSMTNRIAAGQPVPDDWCYIHNFHEPDQPIAAALPAGRGRAFQSDVKELIADLRRTIPAAFAGSDYDQQKEIITREAQQQMDETFELLREEAKKVDYELYRAPGKIMFKPQKDGQDLTTEAFSRLPLKEQHRYQETGRRLEKLLADLLSRGHQLEKDMQEKAQAMEQQITRQAAMTLVNRLRERYEDLTVVRGWLDALLDDVTEHHQWFMEKEHGTEQPALPWLPPTDGEEVFQRYLVHLFINNEHRQGAPVVFESFLNYYSLFGKIEYRSQMMEMSTHFTMARPGALHRANGGYLILQARDVLTEPYVWLTLKRALRYQSAVLENIGEQYRYVPMASMRMQPIPLNVKVIMIGTPLMYQLLSTDEDFVKLFKVKVDFDIEMDRNPDNLRKYASFVQSLCQNDHLLPFSRDGMGQVVEYGSRLAGHQNKLSTRFSEVSEIVYEAHALAAGESAGCVESAHVQAAIDERKYRNSRIEDKVQELILQNKLLIDTGGQVTGQINGLSVIQLGSQLFGQPARITAVTYMGRGGVINIERETDMSGQIHSKGVLTMAGYLGATFAQKFPLSLTAQITFEQNYGGIDGDSASCAELFAILSSLADLPIYQGIAVTGSVNQLGDVQPIGGVTEKVEGFYDICAAGGLSGEQGVIVPVQNVDQLMLRDDIVTAVEKGQFHLYAIRRIEEGIEILTGRPAGASDENGNFPDGSVYGLVMAKLERFRDQSRQASPMVK